MNLLAGPSSRPGIGDRQPSLSATGPDRLSPVSPPRVPAATTLWARSYLSLLPATAQGSLKRMSGCPLSKRSQPEGSAERRPSQISLVGTCDDVRQVRDLAVSDCRRKRKTQPMSTDPAPERVNPPGRFSWLHRFTYVTTWLTLLAFGMLLGGTAWIWIYAFSTPGSHWSYVAVGMLTALAALLTGFLAGFLVGVPKIVSSGQVHLSDRAFSPSTNLSEISDWLTKLLLGAGLVSLSHLGGPIGKLINEVAGGLHGPASDAAAIQAAKVTAGTIMVAFTVLGVLGGYIVTSTWYQKKISDLISATGTGEQQA